jgi:hypothetical protein
MRPSSAVLTVAAALSWGLAFAGSAKLEPVACISPKTLYELLNAANRHDRLETAQLEGSACRPIEGEHYEIVAEKNGVSQIRLFPRAGDWADSRVAYTLDEMLSGANR